MLTSMAGKFVTVVIALLLAFAPVFAAGTLLVRRKRLARQRRRSPLTEGLLRTPGHALREQLEELRLDVAVDLGALLGLPSMVLAAMYVHSLVAGTSMPLALMVLVFVGITGVVAYQIRSLLKRSELMDRLRLGLDAELAVGQELDQLVRDGAVVFHDLPAEKFNIDHVVIAPQGVFAVETKGYSKPNRGGGAADATVVYDGRALVFPEWSSSKPVEQAERQAKWLADWLSSATGEPVHVAPVIALPGWKVELKGRGPVLVISGKLLREHLLKARTATRLAPGQMQRVVHQAEQRRRNVAPAYRPDEA